MKDTLKHSFKKFAFVILGWLAGAAAGAYSALAVSWCWWWFLTPLTEIMPPGVLSLWGVQILLLAFFTFARTGRSDTMADVWLAQHRLDASYGGVARAVYSMLITTEILFGAFILHLFL